MPAPDKSLSVAVYGAAGYVGGELLRLLLGHPALLEVRAFSESRAGEAIGDVHPALAHLSGFEMDAPDWSALEKVDVAFLALPHGRSQRDAASRIARARGLVIDLAADFRVQDRALSEIHYGEHEAPGLLADFVYGLADVQGKTLEGARRVAAPGCFATATLLALRPLARAGVIEGTPACFAITGSTGSGALPKATTHHPVRAHNFFAYAAEGHRHEAEIIEQLRAWSGRPQAACHLFPHSSPLVRGIHATLHARLAEPLAEPLELLRECWGESRFVHVKSGPPELAAVVGTNHAHTHAAPRSGGREVVVQVAIDNLVKGAAGQAIQAMNLALGFPESAGLEFPGLYPC